jgi:hypothetical protein
MFDGAPLKKMLAGLDGGVTYALHLGEQIVPLNERIGGPFTLRFTGARTCMSCGKRVKKFYGQGLCYPCLVSSPQASECIVRPELCRAHLGEGRDAQWEQDHHNTEHFVYLSQTGGIKVGVTRSTQVPIRWIDQGAVLAVLIARTPYRQLAGAIEVDLKRLFADKTNWRAMLAQVMPDREALFAARERVKNELAPELREYVLEAEEPQELTYPVNEWSPKVTSVSLEKLAELTGTLIGIKGQYLLFKDGRVFNVRNHTGYHVELG